MLKTGIPDLGEGGKGSASIIGKEEIKGGMGEVNH